MKIIERGTDPDKRWITTTCVNCLTKFKFKAKEATLVHDQRDGDYFEIKCPLCKKSVIKDKD